MKVTYTHHSSFMAELEHAALLFDYFEGEIPAVEGDKPLFVFASHRHGDHFSRAIFDLADQRRNDGLHGPTLQYQPHQRQY